METATQPGTKEIIHRFVSKCTNIKMMDEDEDLFDSGIVNSLFSIQLISFIEKSFDIKVTADDLDMDNFKSINAVYNFVKRRQSI
jgi:methoxymalonate biosynthesis acyl carrier protein